MKKKANFFYFVCLKPSYMNNDYPKNAAFIVRT